MEIFLEDPGDAYASWWGTCSGTLINNAENDPGLQYLLTARHCLYYVSDGIHWYIDPDLITFYFNFESPECDNTCEGIPINTVISATKLTDDDGLYPLDFMLLQIEEDIPDSYDVYYAGWKNNLVIADALPISSVGIHHPRGDIKKISLSYNNTFDLYNLWPEYFEQNFMIVSYFDEGYAQPGTSGSALFTTNDKIIGIAGTMGSGNEVNCTASVNYNTFYRAYWLGDDMEYGLDNLRFWLNPNSEEITEINGRDWWEIYGCTYSDSYNYDPGATNDDGSCYGQKGDINNDGCINVVDITLLVDLILQGVTYDGNIYQHWAADMNLDLSIDAGDITLLVAYILNNPTCTGGSQRESVNSFITFDSQETLSRGEGDLTEIILTTETEVQAAHFEFQALNQDILDIYMNDEFASMSIDWVMRGDTLAVLFFGSDGQTIQAGSHTVFIIESSGILGRGNTDKLGYINGEYASTDGQLSLIGYDEDGRTRIIPVQFALLQPYPNPFNPITSISYDLPIDCDINIAVYSLNGELVTVLKSGFEHAGSYNITWEAKNLASGLYFVRLISGDYFETQQVILLK